MYCGLDVKTFREKEPESFCGFALNPLRLKAWCWFAWLIYTGDFSGTCLWGTEIICQSFGCMGLAAGVSILQVTRGDRKGMALPMYLPNCEITVCYWTLNHSHWHVLSNINGFPGANCGLPRHLLTQGGGKGTLSVALSSPGGAAAHRVRKKLMSCPAVWPDLIHSLASGVLLRSCSKGVEVTCSPSHLGLELQPDSFRRSCWKLSWVRVSQVLPS